MNPEIETAFTLAKRRYAERGIDVDAAIASLKRTPVSVHCWQGDDVTGFEWGAGELTGGIQATGNHPGKARSAEELRQDLELAITAGSTMVRVGSAIFGARTTQAG